MVSASARSLYLASGGGCIKGAAFREFILWYEHEVGERRFARLVAGLPHWAMEDLHGDKRGLGILASTWYPDVTVHALLDAVVRDLPEREVRRLALHGAAAVMESTLTGLYRVLFEWMASPARYARFGPKLWGSYYDSGRFVIESDDASYRAYCTISAWNTHHPFICELNRGASIAIYKAMKCTEVSCERTSCVAQGGDACRFVTCWRPPA